MSAGMRVCPRDGVDTLLTCTNCGSPICPQCLVRTSVGFRCPTCASGSGRRLRPSQTAWLGAAAVIAIAAVVIVVVAHPWAGATSAKKSPTEPGAAPGFAIETRVVGGYSLQLPASWSAAGDDTPTELSFTGPAPTDGSEVSVHVFLHPTPLDLGTWVTTFAAGLPRVGGVGINTQPITVAGLPGTLLSYQQPVSPNPGAPLATFETYLVKRGGTVFSLQLSSVQSGPPPSVFAQIASSFKLV